MVDRTSHAAELCLSSGQIYILLARTERTVTTLLPRTAVSRRKRLPEMVEEFIARRCASNA